MTSNGWRKRNGVGGLWIPPALHAHGRPASGGRACRVVTLASLAAHTQAPLRRLLAGAAIVSAGLTSSCVGDDVVGPAETPTLAALNEETGARGSVVGVTLTGTNFVAGATAVAVSGEGVTATNVSVTGRTSLTTDFVISAEATLGPRTVTVTTPGGTSGGLPFTVTPPPPTLAAVSPSSAVRGTTVTVTLTGTDFLPDATAVTLSGVGVTASDVRVTSATTLTASFTVDAGAAPGARAVTVTTAGGTSGARSFAVDPVAPTLTGVVPAAGRRGATVPVTVSGGGVSATAVSLASAASLTASLVIAADAALGGRQLTVTTAAGTSGAIVFTVDSAGPILTSLSPMGGVQGTSVVVLLTGTGFVPEETTVTVTGVGITSGQVEVLSSTALRIELAIDAGAAPGARDVTVTTPDGTSNSLAFTVHPPGPTLTDIDPADGVQGTTVAVTLTGTNFVVGATTLSVGGAGVAIANVDVAGSSSLTADFTIAADAPAGARAVTVTTSDGTSNARTFTVHPPGPTLSGIDPAAAVQGTTVAVTLTGTNFVVGATTVGIVGTDVTAANVDVASSTSMTVDFIVGAAAAVGARDVTVTTSDGTSNARTFSVHPPGPTLSGISPAAGVQGTTVAVTLTGTSFVAGGTTVGVVGTDVTAANVDVVSSTSLTVDLTIAAAATLGAHDVTVTTAGGTSGAQSFVVNPPVPTLSNLSPGSGTPGSTVSVTLTGTSFQIGATTVTIGGANVTAANVAVASGTSLTADFTIAGAAALGARDVTVTTAGGTSGATTFTVIAGSGSVLARSGSASHIADASASTTPLATSPAVTVSDGFGNPVSGATVDWSTSTCAAGFALSAATSTSNGSGVATAPTLSVPANTAGSCTVTASINAGGSPVAFLAVIKPAGSVAWLGTSTSFHDAANWSSGSAPNSTTDVFVPRAAPNTATLTADAAVRNLTLESGATLELGGFTLTVSGNVDGSDNSIENGTLRLEGTGAITLRGVLPTVHVGNVAGCGGATYSLSGTTTADALTVNCPLTVGANTLTVGDLSIATATGRMAMTNAASTVIVTGDATFAGGSTNGLMTAGTLELRGGFTQSNVVSASSFAASGSHLTRLTGTGAQSVWFVSTVSPSQFNDLSVENTSASGVTFTSIVNVGGDLSIGAAGGATTKLTLNETLNVNDLTAKAGAVLVQVAAFENSPAILVEGALIGDSLADFGGVDIVRVVGTTFPIYNNTATAKAPRRTHLKPSGTMNVAASGTIAGGVVIDGPVGLNGKALVVQDTFAIRSGSFDMSNTGGTLAVGGHFLHVAGTFSPGSGSLVTLNGTGTQLISFVNAADHFFGSLDITNTGGGVQLSTDAATNGNLRVRAGARLTVPAGKTLTVGPAFTLHLHDNSTIDVAGTANFATCEKGNGVTITGAGSAGLATGCAAVGSKP